MAWKTSRPESGNTAGAVGGSWTWLRMAVVGRVQVRREQHLRWLEWQDQISLVKPCTEFDERGYPVEVRDAGGLITRTRYDELRHPVEEVRASGEVVHYRWNAGGRVADESDQATTASPGSTTDTATLPPKSMRSATRSRSSTIRKAREQQSRIAWRPSRIPPRRLRPDYRGEAVRRPGAAVRTRRRGATEDDSPSRRPDREPEVRPSRASGPAQSSDGLVEEFVYDKSGRVVKASNNHSVVEMIRNNYGDVRIEIQNGQTVIYLYDQNRNRKHRCLPVGGAGGMLWRSFDERGPARSGSGTNGTNRSASAGTSSTG